MSHVAISPNVPAVAEPAAICQFPGSATDTLEISPKLRQGRGRLGRRPPQAAGSGNRLCYLIAQSKSASLHRSTLLSVLSKPE
jgi:hypothetical protein